MDCPIQLDPEAISKMDKDELEKYCKETNERINYLFNQNHKRSEDIKAIKSINDVLQNLIDGIEVEPYRGDNAGGK